MMKDIVMPFKGTVVIPVLSEAVLLSNFNLIHEGVTNMQSRSNESVLWPGLASDISQMHALTKQCTLSARNY